MAACIFCKIIKGMPISWELFVESHFSITQSLQGDLADNTLQATFPLSNYSNPTSFWPFLILSLSVEATQYVPFFPFTSLPACIYLYSALVEHPKKLMPLQLVIPKHHGSKLTDIPDEQLSEILPVVKKLASASGAENYNILQNNGRLAHQVVEHVRARIPLR
jgi:diadenosine tetraphosphate (Ap4A) HIT family hydrolase